MTSATTSRAAAALLALACGGCVASAPVPKGAVFGPQFAEATFELGLADTVGFGVASTQEYRVGPSAEFEEAGVVKIFTWAAKKPTPHLLEAGKPVVVFAKMNRMTGAPGKCPWKNGSLIDTFFQAWIRLRGSTDSTRSTSSSG